MKGLTPGRGILGGMLLIAVGVLILDRLSNVRQPATAQAANPITTAPDLARPDWEPVVDLVARTMRSSYAPVGGELAQLDRDVFVPTPLIEEAVAIAAPVPVRAADPEDPNSGSDAGFAMRHKLTGVMLAGRPLAVVDDQILAVNSDLDGYTLLDVQRDYVVFQHATTGARVTLQLEQGPRKH